MQRNAIVVTVLLMVLIFSGCTTKHEDQPGEIVDTSTNPSELGGQKAQILAVTTDLEEENGWHIVPNTVRKMTISVEAENVETILFWIAETGTGTWAERTLIGYDIDGNDGWSIEWDFGDRIFHDHIAIQALGSDGVTQAIETINVHSVD